MPEPQNLLAGEASPYLLQHAHNPVAWRPWGDAAFAEAKRRDCPVLLSIGYAACHWCHVMAHESFEDEETARLMNALFVNVKVDREERPDVDHVYMAALHAFGEQGGWPLTMFLTPDGAPFYGGTYWPPAPRWGRPGFKQVLEAVAGAWRDKREALLKQGGDIVAYVAGQSAPQPGALIPDDLTRAGENLLRLVDPVHGGIGRAPKFPNAPIFRFLWNERFRRSDLRFREATRALLDALCQGGIYDHLGGGFARYSVDAEWHVPHFEKMLYDNAQILELLADAAAETPTPLYEARARETVEWLKREMCVGDAFAASLDADSEGEEGRFYIWSAEEIDAALRPEARAFKDAYDVRAGGNFEGQNVLRRLAPPGDPAFEAALSKARATLFHLRERRVGPGRDDKVLADWNGLMIAALARAASVFSEPEWLKLARRAFAFVNATLRAPDGSLTHSWRDGRLGPAALLDDYASLARAALALFETSGERADFEAAQDFAGQAVQRFGAADGGVYVSAAGARDAPIVRPRHADDGATPSGAGMLAEVFARLHHLTNAGEWRERAERLIAAFAGDDGLARSPLILLAADHLERGGAVVVEGALDDATAESLRRAALAHQDPAFVVLSFDRARWSDAPFDRPPAPHPPAAMLCRGQTCSLAVRTAAELSQMIAPSVALVGAAEGPT